MMIYIYSKIFKALFNKPLLKQNCVLIGLRENQCVCENIEYLQGAYYLSNPRWDQDYLNFSNKISFKGGLNHVKEICLTY